MKVTLTQSYKWKSIDFCCPEMGKQVMEHNIQPDCFLDRFPRFGFYIKDWISYIDYCPYCGAKIESQWFEDE